MGSIGPTFIAVVTGVIGLAVVAVLVGQRAQTSSVLQAGGTALSQIIGAAVSPVATGNQYGSGGTSIGGVTQ